MTDAPAARPRIAFYAPMKSANHPTPSGDRRIARLTLDALRLAGFDPVVVSEFRSLEMTGDAVAQTDLLRQAKAEREKTLNELRPEPPALWFTYHCYYKAPDLLGPDLAQAFGIPYVISEASISTKRRDGAYATFAERSEAAIAEADCLFWTTRRDEPALKQAGHAHKMTHLPAFVETPDTPAKRNGPRNPVRLLTVAMMRAGDKLESYRRLAAALLHVERDWHLTIIGDGSERPQVERVFAPFKNRVTLTGQVDDRAALTKAFENADIFVWPGVGEGVGMVYLEAQASGLPVVAEDHPAPAELIAGPCAPANDPRAFAKRITALANPDTYNHASEAAHAHITSTHSITAAARTLRETLKPLLS